MEPLRCDVAVIGAGPAGLAAAAAAAEAGRRVIIADEGLASGGQIWRPDVRHGSPPIARSWQSRLEASRALTLSRTSIVSIRRSSASGPFVLTGECDGAARVMHAKRVVLATGARELFLPFPGWTLPGVLGAGGAQALLKSGLDVQGKRVVIAGSGPLLLPVAASMARAGARLLVVAEQASRASVIGYATSLWRQPSLIVRAARYRAAFVRASFLTGTWVKAARGQTDGIAATLSDGHRDRLYECDLLCAAFGLVPNTELARQVGCDVRDGRVVVDEQQRTSVLDVFCAGEPTGIGGAELALLAGETAGRAAAGLAETSAPRRRRARLAAQASRMNEAFALRPELRHLADADTIVCRCEDVRLGEIDRAWSPRQAKLYTRVGMGPCQGRICGAALHFLFDWTHDTIREPVQPAGLSTLLADATPSEIEPHPDTTRA